MAETYCSNAFVSNGVYSYLYSKKTEFCSELIPKVLNFQRRNKMNTFTCIFRDSLNLNVYFPLLQTSNFSVSTELKFNRKKIIRRSYVSKLEYENENENESENENENEYKLEHSRDNSNEFTEITSPKNDFINHCVKIRRASSYRKLSKSFLLVGDDPVKELFDLIDNNPKLSITIDTLFILKGCSPSSNMLKRTKNAIFVNSLVMQKLSGFKTSSSSSSSSSSLNFVAVVKYPPKFFNFISESKMNSEFDSNSNINFNDFKDQDLNIDFDFDSKLKFATGICFEKEPKRVLILDAIQDPGNLGTLIRTAVAFAWDCILLLPGCCDPFNEKALNASKGAIFRIPMWVGNWNTVISLAQIYNLELYAATPLDSYLLESSSSSSSSGNVNSEVNEKYFSLDDLAEESALGLVLGNEGQGISKMAQNVCKLVEIPMPGKMESLNVAIAGGILMFTLKKR